MALSSAGRRRALTAQAKQELDSLIARGVLMNGNAASPVLMIRGDLNEQERSGGDLLAGRDGAALHSALQTLGFAPEDFCAFSVVATAAPDPAMQEVPAGELISAELMRETLEAFDPECVIVLDETAANVLREAYSSALAIIDDFNSAMLMPGLVVNVLGRRVLVLDGFEAALDAPKEKQRMWAWIKQLKPATAPY